MQGLQGIRPLAAARSSLRASPVASSSRTRLPLVKPYSTGNDRYLIIRDFFTRQSAYARPASTPIRTPIFDRSTVQTSFRLGIRHNSCTTKPTASPEGSSPTTSDTKPTDTGECPHCSAPPIHRRDHAQNYTPFIRRLIQQSSLPLRANYRPSKEELLGAASSWWERLRIRIKWFTIRGWRRFNTDDLSAFASWFVLGNTIWILIGTTTFVSAVFATLNSLSLQEYVARWISDYMTSETGVTVIFESAIVPRWGASTISFRNVYISRRPSASEEGADTEASAIPDEALPKSRSSTFKPKPKTQTTTPPSPIPFLSSSLSPSTYYAPPAEPADNYTMFDVNLDEVTVTLSFMRWLDGKGLIKDAKVKGVRGVIDRRSVWWDTSQPLIPEKWRHEVHPGDFEFESLQVEDALLTIYQPGGQRPYNVSVFNAAIGPFRKRYLFYDMMAAEAITGQFDNCLFSLHMPQKLGRMAGVEEDGIVKRMARFRVDGLPIEHAQYATGHTGPISWITSGKVDAVLDIKFPFHPDEQVDFRSIVDQIGRNVGKISMGDHPDTAIPAMPALSQGLAQGQWQWQGEGRREGETEGEARARRERRRRATVLEERREIAREDAVREKQRAERQAGAAAAAAEAVVQAQTKVEVVPLTSSAASSTTEVAATNSATATPGINPGNSRLARPPLRAPSTERESAQKTDIADERAAAAASPTWTVSDGETPDLGGLAAKRQVTIDIDLRFRDLKAAVPLYTTDLSVTNNALIRPIVAFINANRTLVPIHCQVAADLTDFDGSWTLFETGLMSSISDQIYDALAHHVSSEAANSKRIRQVSMWGIQRGAEALLDTLRNVVDPVHAQLMAAAI